MSYINNIAFSSGQRSSTVYKWKHFKTFLNKCVGLFHWRKCYYGPDAMFKVKMPQWQICFLKKYAAFHFTKMLTDGLEWCGLLVDCNVFISCLDSFWLHHHHWWASDNDIMLNFSKSVLMKKQTPSWMAWGWVNIFGEIFL